MPPSRQADLLAALVVVIHNGISLGQMRVSYSSPIDGGGRQPPCFSAIDSWVYSGVRSVWSREPSAAVIAPVWRVAVSPILGSRLFVWKT